MLPVLLLPGMMCDARLFAPQLIALAEYDCSVMAITEYDTVADLAAHILDHAPPKFALAGLSMGGIVAMAIVAQASERVEKLCLMDTNPLAEIPEIQQRREPQIAKVRAGQLRQVMQQEMKPLYLADSERVDILDLCLDMAQSLGAEVFERQSRALQSRPDQCPALRDYSGKTLILHGRHDRLCPQDRHELIQECIPHADYVIIEEAGHLPTLEQPEATAEAIRRWLV